MHSYTLIATTLALFSVTMSATAFSPVSSKPILIFHTTVISNRTFEATRAAIEANIPPLNTTYATLLRSGDLSGAAAALAALPVPNQFILPARDFGQLTSIVGLRPYGRPI